MPLVRDGTRWVRAPYDPKFYTVPPQLFDEIRRGSWGGGSRQWLAERDGPFMGMIQRGERTHDGTPYVVLTNTSAIEFAIEVELTDGAIGDLRALPPEEAWQLALARDATMKPPVTLA